MRISRSTFLIGLTAATLLALACASTRSAGTQLDDSTISTRVKSKLAADPEVNPFNIDVDTLDGVVTLRGRVEDERAETMALSLARSTSGVVEVIDEIEIGTKRMAERGSDAWITTKIKSKLAGDPEVNPFNIDVDVADGRVILSGRVRNARAKAEAEKLATDTAGVVEVDNRIEVVGE